MAFSLSGRAPLDFGQEKETAHVSSVVDAAAPPQRLATLMLSDPDAPGMLLTLDEFVRRRPNLVYMDTLKRSVDVFPSAVFSRRRERLNAADQRSLSKDTSPPMQRRRTAGRTRRRKHGRVQLDALPSSKADEAVRQEIIGSGERSETEASVAPAQPSALAGLPEAASLPGTKSTAATLPINNQARQVPEPPRATKPREKLMLGPAAGAQAFPSSARPSLQTSVQTGPELTRRHGAAPGALSARVDRESCSARTDRADYPPIDVVPTWREDSELNDFPQASGADSTIEEPSIARSMSIRPSPKVSRPPSSPHVGRSSPRLINSTVSEAAHRAFYMRPSSSPPRSPMSRQSTPRQPTPRHDQESLVRGVDHSMGPVRAPSNVSGCPSRPSRFIVKDHLARVPPDKVRLSRLGATERSQHGTRSVVGAEISIDTTHAGTHASWPPPLGFPPPREAHTWLVDQSNGSLPSTGDPSVLLLPDGIDSHLSTRQLTSACETLLGKLYRQPNDGRLDLRFFQNTQEFKYIPPQRWAKWPFVEVESNKDAGRVFSQPPGEMEPVFFVHHTESAIEVGWSEYTIRPDVDYDGYEVYHVEACKLCPIDGPAPWRRIYSGKACSHVLRGLDKYADALVRVRAHNSKGPGPWSEVRRFGVFVPPRPEPTELREIPTAWWGIDIDDLIRGNSRGRHRLEDGTERFEQEMENIFDTLHTHRSAIKIAYRYYSLLGASGSKDGSEGAGLMNATQFLNFAKALDLSDGRTTPVKDVDLNYKRSTREVDLGKDEFEVARIASMAVSAMSKGLVSQASPVETAVGDSSSDTDARNRSLSKHWRQARDASRATNAFKKGATGTMMAQHQFVGGLLRLAYERYPHILSISGRMHELCTRFVVRHVYDELDLLNDPFSVLVPKQPLLAALRKHRAPLEKIFVYYAAQDVSLGAEKTTMNLRELMVLCEDGALIDSYLGLRDVVNAFARVNIEDDLYAQSDAKNLSTELVFDEFFEVLARLYKVRAFGAHSVIMDEGLELARGFHAWLKQDLYPAVNAAIKQRKKGL